MPKVYNYHHKDAPPDAVPIGRDTPWGNPFRLRDYGGNRQRVIALFCAEILPTLDVSELRGKDLVCFCKPLACHGDAILEKANR